MSDRFAFRQLRYFVAVAETENFTRAARDLHISQPPLSRQIRNLENSVGAQLISRDRRGTRLTAAGRSFLRDARRILEQADRAAETAREVASGRTGTVKVGFASTALYGPLPGLIRRIRQTHPDIRIQLSELPVADQIAGIKDESIDVGIAVSPPEEQGFGQKTISEEGLIVCLPADHARASGSSRRPISAARLAGESFVAFPRELAPQLFDRIAAYLQSVNVPYNVVQEVVQTQTIVGLVSSGLGIAIVPESMQNLQRSDVAYRKIAPDTPRILTRAIWAASNENPSLSLLVDMLTPSARIRHPAAGGASAVQLGT